MMQAMTAGKREKSSHIISFTATGSEMEIMVWPESSVNDTKPAKPSSKATSEPLMAVPNFIAMVPLEKIRPVEEVPFFSVE